MSYLIRDYEWYYCGTWLGFRKGGAVIPFFVEEILCDSQLDEFGDPLDEVELDDLSFDGFILTDSESNSERLLVSVTDDNLVYELPNLGVFSVNGRDQWLRYMPQRSVKKGLCSNRIVPNISMHDYKLMWDIYSKGFNPNKHNFSFTDTQVFYKGLMLVGNINGDDIFLMNHAQHLYSPLLKQLEETHGDSCPNIWTP